MELIEADRKWHALFAGPDTLSPMDEMAEEARSWPKVGNAAYHAATPVADTTIVTGARTMNEPLQVLGIAGSLRRGSLNRGLLRAAIELSPDDVRITPYEGLRAIPPYDGDVEAVGDPEPVRALKDRVRAADALLIVSPEYNYGIPGVLKNAIDWVSRPPRTSPLYHKPVAIMGASTGNFGTARCQLALRQTFHFTKSYVLIEPDVLVVRAAEHFDGDGNLRDEATREHVTRLVEALARWTRGLWAGAIIPETSS